MAVRWRSIHGTNWLAGILVAILAVQCASATSVVVLRSSKVLVAAIDSLETYQVFGEGANLQHDNVCKIARTGPFYVLVSGLTRGFDGSGDPPFDVVKEIEAAKGLSQDMSTLGPNLWDLLSPRLTVVLEAIRAKDPMAFASKYSGAAALQLTVVGVEANRPAAKVVEFAVDSGTTGAVRLRPHFMGCASDCPSSSSGYFLGVHGAIDDFVRYQTTFIAKPDTRKAEVLIQLSYKERPDLVGGPVSMLSVSRGGVEVVSAGACHFQPQDAGVRGPQ